MRCEESKKYLDTYIDGELEAGLMLEVETHLSECRACSSLVLLGRRMRKELRSLGRVQAPDHLRRRVLTLSGRGRRARLVAAAIAVPLAAAAALLIVLGPPLRGGSDDGPVAGLLDDVVQRHARDLPMEVKASDPAEVSSWFRGKVDFPVVAPALTLANASFEGARLSNVQSDQAAHMTYSVDGHRVTLMIFNPRAVALSGGRRVKVDGRDVLLGHRHGYNVAVLLDGDLAYALSSDLPESRLVSLIRSIH
ncbi:MAG: zf-HC2 domain-containing protein [Deltaproteobacteria bacterium]|nr:zf-HC2 domain-containing protein [Deltaproteobacteria bacterium]